MKEAKKELSNGDFVIPGEKIGVIEMYFPGPGTYEDDGKIYATVMGNLKINKRERIISVINNKKIPIPERNDIVIGRVGMIKKQVAIVEINNNNKFNANAIFSADLHISNVAKSYVDNISDVFKPFDVIRARVLSNKDTFFQITTASSSLGVILAYCVICGSVLELRGKNLYCTSCNRFEQRKIARDYGSMKL
ncbi:MAG: exosome complex RNA-binding protein Csl4 [Candidatus Helarchaeota archaeon]|nr:exosome complex RNA-binding protein Csl4 [Candidatus Helarchaeota archaeon]